MSKISQCGSGVIAIVLAALVAGSAIGSVAQAQTLTSEQQSAASTLSTRALDAIKKLPPSSSPSAFESAILDVTHDYFAGVIVVAMDRVAGTPGIPGAAIDAAHHIQRAFADEHGPRGEYDFYNTGSTPGVTGPYFALGGGGGTASSYNR